MQPERGIDHKHYLEREAVFDTRSLRASTNAKSGRLLLESGFPH
jgi:hypothetical protein